MKKKFLALILAISMVAALTACGGSAANSNNAANGETGTDSAEKGDAAAKAEELSQEGAASADATLAADGVLDIGYVAGIDSLTPFRSNIARNAPFMANLYESLATFDSDLELHPWVAESWSTTDNLTYDVKLREGIKDSEGNEITAADVVWFIEESKARSLKPCFAKVDKVEQTGDYSLKLTMTLDQIGAFELVMTDTFVISKAAFEASADEFSTSVVSTSAYKVTEFTASASLAFERVDEGNYWQSFDNIPECVRPMVQKCNYHFITEASQTGIALETNVVDVALEVPNSTAVQFVDNSEYVIELSPGNQGYQLFFSGADSRPVGNDEKLRQAICYAIDNAGLVVGLCSDMAYGDVMADVTTPRHIGYNTAWESEDYYNYDVEKAKAALAESNYNGETLSLLVSNSTVMSRMAQMIQAYCSAIGVTVELDSRDLAGITAIRLDGTQYDMFINTIGGTYCSDHWAIRYDPNAYSTGDGTSRHDYELADLLYETWTVDGYTQENIDKVHNYIKESAIAYGLLNPKFFTIWSNHVGMEKEMKGYAGYMMPTASTWTNF